MTINAVDRTERVLPSFDGSLDFRYPNGDKPGPPPEGAANVTTKLIVSGWGQEATASGATTVIRGPVPLGCMFNTLGTTSSLTADQSHIFRMVGAHFDFGDGAAGTATWSHSGKYKHHQKGGLLAAHVYDIAGTYTAGVRVQSADGSYQDKFLTIIAENADAYWSASGRSTVTLTAGIAAWPTFVSGTQYVLTGGGNYTSHGLIDISLNKSDIGFRTTDGTRATVSGVRVSNDPGQAAVNAATAYPSMVNISDMDCVSLASGTVFSCRFVVYKNIRFRAPYSYAAVVQNYAQHASVTAAAKALIFWPHDIHHYQCLMDNTKSLSGANSFSGNFFRSSVMGCETQNSPEHGIRVFRANLFVLAHNFIHDANANQRSVVKLQSAGQGSASYTIGVTGFSAVGNLNNETRDVIVCDNKLGDGGDPGSWAVSVGPQANDFNEGCTDILVENNVFMNHSGPSPVDIQSRGCVRLVSRGNTFSTATPEAMYVAGTMAASEYGPYFCQVRATDGVQFFRTETPIVPDKPGT